MRISPLDIRKQAFKKTLRGVDAEEVRIFLELVASEYEKVLQENAMMAERLHNQEERLGEYRELEKSMRNSLVTADRIASESRDSSEREAARIVQDAQMRAERILEDARERLQDLIREIETLKGKKEVYARRFWTLLEGQIGMLQEHLQDMGEVDSLRKRVEQLIQEAHQEASAEEPPAESPRRPSPGGLDQVEDSRPIRVPGLVEELTSFDQPPAPARGPLQEILLARPALSGAPPEAPPERGTDRPRGLPRGLGKLLQSRQASLPLDDRPPEDDRRTPAIKEGERGFFPIQERSEGHFDLSSREQAADRDGYGGRETSSGQRTS